MFQFGFEDSGGDLVVLVNAKYELGFVMILRLMLWLKELKRS
jgi:hypothetical protein